MRTALSLVLLGLCWVAQSAEIRQKRTADDWDPLSYIVNMKYPMKKNKAITGFSQEEKDNMLHLHNAYRSLVRPYASDMVEMQWDDDIAAFAQEWANECTATHRPNRDLSPYINMGENLYWWFSGSYNEAKAVKYWWDELQYYDMDGHSCEKHEVCGHYITMVWAKSEKLGCGVARCHRLEDMSYIERESYYFVCSYSGRFVSKNKPYKGTDTPCSNCHQTDFPRCRYNLCVSQDMIDNNIGYNGTTDITGLQREYTYSSKRSNGEAVLEPAADTSYYSQWLTEKKNKKKKG